VGEEPVKEEELRQALESVLEYFRGKEVNVNTVLAAHLRSRGLAVSGQPWEAAKRAMEREENFEKAVLAASAEPKQGGTPAPVPASQEPTPFAGSALGWFPKPFGPGDIDGEGAKKLLGTPNIDAAWVLVRETAQNSWDARGTAPNIDFTMNLRLLESPVVDILRKRIFTGEAPKTGLDQLLKSDKVWALEVSDRGAVGLNGPIRNDLAVDSGTDTNFIDLVFNIGAPRDVHLGAGTYGFGKTITYVASSVGAVLIWSRCEGARGLDNRLIGSAIGDSYNMDGRKFTGRHWWGNAMPEENRVEPAVGHLAEELGEKVFAADFGGKRTGTSILILDPVMGENPPEEYVRRLADAAVWNLWPKLLVDQNSRSRMNIEIQLNGQSVVLPVVERHSVLSGYAQCLLAVRAMQAGQDLATVSIRYPMEIHPVWLERPRTLLGHLALTKYPIPAKTTEPPSRSISLMRNQAELVVKYFERQGADVDGFQWAGVFKPVAAVDDSFAFAEPPAHDDWVPKAIQEKGRRREVNVALQRIKEYTDKFLSPRKGSGRNPEAPVSAAYVGDMLADLVSGLEGPAPSSRVSSSGRAVGGLPGWNSPQGSGVDTTPSGESAPSGNGASSVLPGRPLPQGNGAGQPLSNEGSSSGSSVSPAQSHKTSSPDGAGRRGARPRADLVAVSYEPADAPGWTRTRVDVRLSDVSPVKALVEVSVRVGVDGGSIEDNEVVRIIGWTAGQDATCDNHSQEFLPGESRQFVFEARSGLAIDVDAKAVVA
jgi:hypothetical protein